VTNKRRVQLAARSIRNHGDKEDTDTMAVDLLADMMHWSQARGIDFHDLLEWATSHYEAERADEELAGRGKP